MFAGQTKINIHKCKEIRISFGKHVPALSPLPPLNGRHKRSHLNLVPMYLPRGVEVYTQFRNNNRQRTINSAAATVCIYSSATLTFDLFSMDSHYLCRSKKKRRSLTQRRYTSMGYVASNDTGDTVCWDKGYTLKKTLPAGIYSQICY